MKKTLIRISSIVGAIVCAIAVLFVPFSHKIEPKNMLSASADTSVAEYTFTGSSIWVPHSIYRYTSNRYLPNTRSDGSYVTLFSNFMFTIKKVSSNSLTFNVSGSSVIDDALTKYTGLEEVALTSNEASFYLLMTEETGSSTYQFYINFYVSSNNIVEFIPNIYKLQEWYSWDPVNYIGGNHIRYYDINDNYLDISVTCWFKPVGVYADASDTPFGMTDRLYYFTNELSESQQYKSGYNAGYSGGFAEGETSGYGKGYSAGNRVGYNNGYNAGANAANQYTFTNLVSSFVDVPVQTFIGLFNFELLGVNLAGFFTGLMTLAFIITIVRLLKG